MDCATGSESEGFVLSASTQVHFGRGAGHLADYFQEHFACLFGFEPAEVAARPPGRIEVMAPSSRLPAEGYSLNVGGLKEKGPLLIEIAESTQRASLLHALQTVRQMLPSAAFGGAAAAMLPIALPRCRIRDWPRYKWRGLMLDVARHFFSLGRVKRLLLLMSMHKLNVLHLHLSDDQGWRIEVTSRPELALVGGTRGTSVNRPQGDENGQKIYNGTSYAEPRFFTQQEVRELVAFAKELEIQVVPEIDVPAHAAALIIAARSKQKDLGVVELHEGCAEQQADAPLTAPPNCMGGTHGIIIPTQEAMDYILGAVEEVAGLFPGPYFHLGGDEADEFRDDVYSRETSEKLKEKLVVTSSALLQGYMVDEVHRLLTRLGKTAIAWDETHFGLEDYRPPSDMLAMWWRDWSQEAVWEMVRDLGPRLILAPNSKMYLDLYQVEPHSDSRHRVQEGTVSLRSTYSASRFEANGTLGVHGCLWSEQFTSPQVLEYQLFPRGAAIAEVGWTPKAKADDFDGFYRRWQTHADRLTAMSVEHYDGNYTGTDPDAPQPAYIWPEG